MLLSSILFFIVVSQTAGMNEREVVTEKALYTISEFKKPGGLLLPDPMVPLDSLTGVKERKLSLQISNLSEEYYKGSIKFMPVYLRVPVSKSIAVATIKIRVPLPPKKYGVKKWSLAVFGPRGEVVRQFEGKGYPPDYVTWNGRYADEYITPGATYSTILTYVDRFDRKRNIIGSDIKVSGIRGKIKDRYILKMVSDSIFIENTYKLRADSRERLDEIANFLKEHIFGMLIVRVKGDPGDLLSKRINVLYHEILKRVPVDPARLKIEPVYFAPGDLKIATVEVVAG